METYEFIERLQHLPGKIPWIEHFELPSTICQILNEKWEFPMSVQSIWGEQDFLADRIKQNIFFRLPNKIFIDPPINQVFQKNQYHESNIAKNKFGENLQRSTDFENPFNDPWLGIGSGLSLVSLFSDNFISDSNVHLIVISGEMGGGKTTFLEKIEVIALSNLQIHPQIENPFGNRVPILLKCQDIPPIMNSIDLTIPNKNGVYQLFYRYICRVIQNKDKFPISLFDTESACRELSFFTRWSRRTRISHRSVYFTIRVREQCIRFCTTQ